MSFITDVVYGLKNDYGKPITLYRATTSVDAATGNKITTITSQRYVPLAIFIALNMRQAFYRAINLREEGLLKSGEQQIIVDVADLDVRTAENDYFIDAEGSRFDVTKVEDIDHEAMIITAKLLK